MDILKCIKCKTFFVFCILFICQACSQTRELKNQLHIYNWKPQKSNNISLTILKDGKVNRVYNENILLENKFDNLNQTNFTLIEFKNSHSFSMDNEYELKIDKLSFLIKNFKVNSKSQGNDVTYTVNGKYNEIGDDNIIKIDINQYKN